jgi:hypothetical protein
VTTSRPSGESATTPKPASALDLVDGRHPVAVVEVHVEEFGVAVAVEVEHVEDAARVLLKVAVGLEGDGAPALVEGEREEVARR